MTRLLYLTPGCFDKGGISRYSRYQIEALRLILGPANVCVLSLLGPDSESLETPFEVDWYGASRRGQVGLLNRAAFATRALQCAALWRPDIVLSAHVNFGPLLSTAGGAASAATVLNVYGLELWSGLSKARRNHMGRVDLVISDCHATAEYVTGEQLHAKPPTVIWDPVDLARFSPAQPEPAVIAKYGLPDPTAHRVVLSFGRLAKAAAHKGFDRLIPVIAELAPRMPDLRLVIAGRGDDRPRLESLAREHGIEALTIFTGAVDEADLPDLYRSATVFSLVSDRGLGRGEGIPLTPLEAMACGVPILVGDEDGSREAVMESRNGIVVSPRRPEDHVDALAAVLANPQKRVEMSTEARRVATEHFSFHGFREKHERALASLLGGGGWSTTSRAA